MVDVVKNRIEEHMAAVELLMSDGNGLDAIHDIANYIVESLKNGGRLLICGNGGSAADAQHLATELVSKFYKERKALNAEAITVNSSTLTAIGNDYSFDFVFSRQIESRTKKGDIVLGISTSGNSENVVLALKAAKELGAKCIGFVGEKQCNLDEICDCIFHAPSKDTPRIQEIHILVGHIICEIIEKELA